MSATPSPRKSSIALGGERDRTPELTSKSREKRHREDDDGNDRSGREHRHRQREDDEERRERRHRRDNETEEERDERRRRRRERDDRERDRDDGGRRGSRDRSRESHRSHRSRDVPAIREMSREEKERAREERDRLMADEKREAARLRDERFAQMDRERERDRRMRDRPRSPPRGRRGSPSYAPPPPPPPRDPATQIIDEAEEEARSVYVSQLAARLTSADLGLFFEDKLGRGSVRDARVIHDRASRRSKGCGFVSLDAVSLVPSALALAGTIVMGIPINVQASDPEGRNLMKETRAARENYNANSSRRPAGNHGRSYPPLSTGLAFPPGIDKDSHREAAIPYHRLLVSDLASNLSTDDIRQIFQSFGTIEFVDLHLDFSGRSVGTAYVQFSTSSDAAMALEAMNGFELAGRKIRVSTVQERSTYVAEQIEESSGYGTRLDAAQRQQLMFKLARTDPPANLALSAHKSSRGASPPPVKVAPVNPSPYVVASNMFNPEEETERDWDLDLAEDIEGELKSKYGAVKRIKVDKLSSSGEVYIEFVDQAAAERAVTGLNGRFFGGRKLGAVFTSATLFKVHM